MDIVKNIFGEFEKIASSFGETVKYVIYGIVGLLLFFLVIKPLFKALFCEKSVVNNYYTSPQPQGYMR